MKAQAFRAGAELCHRLLETAKRRDVREALAALQREYENAAAAEAFQSRNCGGFASPNLGAKLDRQLNE
jgi:hypothetical protein